MDEPNTTPPPHSTPPPVITPPPQQTYYMPEPRKRSSGGGWKFLAIVLMIILLLSLASKFGGLFGRGVKTGHQSGTQFHEILVEDNHSTDKIAIIDVEGMITSMAWDNSGRNMVDLLEDKLKVAARDNSVKAVILKVDSPGGEVMA